MRWLMKILGQGFMVVLPILLTVAVVFFVVIWAGRLVINPILGLFPEGNEWLQVLLGALSFFTLVFVIGALMNFWLVRKLYAWVESKLRKLPFVKTVFGSIQDIVRFLGMGKGEKKGDMVVVVDCQNGWRQVGIITRKDLKDLPPALAAVGEDRVAVYFPFSYQLGGFSYFVERSQCHPVPGMSVEDAMRYSMMGWLGGDEKNNPPDRSRVEPMGEKGQVRPMGT